MRGPIEEGEYEIDTINLLASHDDVEYKMKAIDRADVIIAWLNGLTRRQLRAYRTPIERMLLTLKDILKDIDNAVRYKGSNEDSD